MSKANQHPTHVSDEAPVIAPPPVANNKVGWYEEVKEGQDWRHLTHAQRVASARRHEEKWKKRYHQQNKEAQLNFGQYPG